MTTFMSWVLDPIGMYKFFCSQKYTLGYRAAWVMYEEGSCQLDKNKAALIKVAGNNKHYVRGIDEAHNEIHQNLQDDWVMRYPLELKEVDYPETFGNGY